MRGNEGNVMENKWISVNKKLPEPQTQVLIYAPSCDIIGPILTGEYFAPEKNFKGSWTVYGFREALWGQSELVTHWMPLPEKP